MKLDPARTGSAHRPSNGTACLSCAVLVPGSSRSSQYPALRLSCATAITRSSVASSTNGTEYGNPRKPFHTRSANGHCRAHVLDLGVGVWLHGDPRHDVVDRDQQANAQTSSRSAARPSYHGTADSSSSSAFDQSSRSRFRIATSRFVYSTESAAERCDHSGHSKSASSG